MPALTQPIANRDAAALRTQRGLLALLCTAALAAGAGCAVPQPRGTGALERIVEPGTGRAYWRYLPQDYAQTPAPDARERRRPLVVTFHGLKPFDSAHGQAREWAAEADRYGFIVVAPHLRSINVLSQFPVRTAHSAFREDEQAVLAILDHVLETTSADPQRVLSTSWSSGGYMAHYMLNRHPDRFTCLGVRQSNFSGGVLDPGMTTRSIEHPVLIISTEHDFGICQRESRQALDWYKQHGYRDVAWLCLKGLGHARTPEPAAAFFARVCEVESRLPSPVLARRQTIAYEASPGSSFTP